MTRDESLTFIHNDDGPIDRRRVERILQLEAENAALREIAQWLVDMPDAVSLYPSTHPNPPGRKCVLWCRTEEVRTDGTFEHTPACPFTRARALLVSQEPPEV